MQSVLMQWIFAGCININVPHLVTRLALESKLLSSVWISTEERVLTKHGDVDKEWEGLRIGSLCVWASFIAVP